MSIGMCGLSGQALQFPDPTIKTSNFREGIPKVDARVPDALPMPLALDATSAGPRSREPSWEKLLQPECVSRPSREASWGEFSDLYRAAAVASDVAAVASDAAAAAEICSEGSFGESLPPLGSHVPTEEEGFRVPQFLEWCSVQALEDPPEQGDVVEAIVAAAVEAIDEGPGARMELDEAKDMALEAALRAQVQFETQHFRSPAAKRKQEEIVLCAEKAKKKVRSSAAVEWVPPVEKRKSNQVNVELQQQQMEILMKGALSYDWKTTSKMFFNSDGTSKLENLVHDSNISFAKIADMRVGDNDNILVPDVKRALVAPKPPIPTPTKPKPVPRAKPPPKPARAPKSLHSKGQSNLKWDEMFCALRKFIEEKKWRFAEEHPDAEWTWDGNVPTTYKTACGKALGRWINNQRSAKHKGVLKPDRDRRLVSTGLKWSVLSTNSWQDMMTELKLYVREKTNNGKNSWDGNVPTNYRIKSNIAADGSEIDEEKNLGRWINRQRSLFQSGKLKKERQKELEDIGLKWSVLSTSTWQVMFEALGDYAKTRRDAHREWDGNVPANYKTAGTPQKNLGRWVNRQRLAQAKNKLKPQFARKLQDLGLKWNVHDKPAEVSPPKTLPDAPPAHDVLHAYDEADYLCVLEEDEPAASLDVVSESGQFLATCPAAAASALEVAQV